MRKTVGMIVTVLVMVGMTASAQVDSSHPGYYGIEEMGVLAKSDLEVDIDLQGAMLKVAAGALQEEEGGDDADLAQLVAGLERVRVQVGSPQGADATTIAYSFETAIANLESSGWNRILRVMDEGEQVHIFAREGNGNIVGLTVLVNDGDEEIVLVNIVGDIDPVVLGKMIAKADQLPNLERFMDADE